MNFNMLLFGILCLPSVCIIIGMDAQFIYEHLLSRLDNPAVAAENEIQQQQQQQQQQQNIQLTENGAWRRKQSNMPMFSVVKHVLFILVVAFYYHYLASLYLFFHVESVSSLVRSVHSTLN
jgi:hypothetical protein